MKTKVLILLTAGLACGALYWYIMDEPAKDASEGQSGPIASAMSLAQNAVRWRPKFLKSEAPMRNCGLLRVEAGTPEEILAGRVAEQQCLERRSGYRYVGGFIGYWAFIASCGLLYVVAVSIRGAYRLTRRKA